LLHDVIGKGQLVFLKVNAKYFVLDIKLFELRCRLNSYQIRKRRFEYVRHRGRQYRDHRMFPLKWKEERVKAVYDLSHESFVLGNYKHFAL
jgi:hypothetical protein